MILVHGTQEHTELLHEDVATVLAPLGLRLSPAKTRILHMSDGFDFLGFRIQWRTIRGRIRTAFSQFRGQMCQSQPSADEHTDDPLSHH